MVNQCLPVCTDQFLFRTLTSVSDHREVTLAQDDVDSITDAHKLEAHKQAASRAFEQQWVDREEARNGRGIYLTFDMQKTLPLPKLSVGDAFYLRQLWLYNVGVHMIQQSSEMPMFHIWTENEARRGPSEVCSSLFASLNGIDTSNSPPRLVAWSDSCAGQNKHFFSVLCFLQFLLLTGRLRD